MKSVEMVNRLLKGCALTPSFVVLVAMFACISPGAWAETPAKASGTDSEEAAPAGETVEKVSVPAGQRFQAFGDGTVLDRSTGLMWTENANIAGAKMPWEEAETFLTKMNTGVVPGYGYNDWRFPTVKEFESLVDKAFTDPALPLEHPFKNVKNDYYWSGSTGHYIADYAWVMDMAYGFVHFDYRSYCNYLHLWPVRSSTKTPKAAAAK